MSTLPVTNASWARYLRGGWRSSVRLVLSDGYVDLTRRVVLRAGEQHSLTPIEQRLLEYLAARPKTSVSLDELAEQVWGHAPTVRSRAPYVAIQRLRRKLEPDPSAPTHLRASPGGGYELVLAAPKELVRRPTTTFIGRNDELVHLAALWSDGARLISVTGPAGVGKTRLSQEFLHADFMNLGVERVATLDGSVTPDKAGVEAAAAHALGLAQTHTGLQTALGTRPTLLVLDDAESYYSVAQQLVVTWLAEAPALRVLVTTQRALDVPGEQVFRLDPLPTSAGVDLLVDRLAQRTPRPELEASDLRLLANYVDDVLGGLPLAIELGASRLAALGLKAAQGDARWLERAPIANGRWDSLGTALRHAWSTLDEPTRQALVQCAEFDEPFDLVDAESVVELDQGLVANALQRLVEHSLLLSMEGQFRLLPAVRQFARRQSGFSTEVKVRYARWVAHQAESGREFSTAALWRGCRVAQDRGDEPTLGRLARAWDAAMELRGDVNARIAGLSTLLNALPTHGEDAQHLRCSYATALFWGGQGEAARQALEPWPEASTPEIRARRALIQLTVHKTNPWPYAGLALTLAREHRNPETAVAALTSLAASEWNRGDFTFAQQLVGLAQPLAPHITDPSVRIELLRMQAILARSRGEATAARPHLERALQLARDFKMDRVAVGLGINLARLQRILQDYEAAADGFTDVKITASLLGLRRYELAALLGKSALLIYQESYREVQWLLDRDPFPPDPSFPEAWGWQAVQRGITAWFLKQPTEAETELRAAGTYAYTHRFGQVLAATSAALIAALLAQGRKDDAERAAAQFEKQFTELGISDGAQDLTCILRANEGNPEAVQWLDDPTSQDEKRLLVRRILCSTM